MSLQKKNQKIVADELKILRASAAAASSVLGARSLWQPGFS